ncbi:hypothetical protein WBG78_19080 [Chryseolinea sp. T2]|uniref:hypothetical protein n=1 Tax=Chryseolinea sp. T2 TaxID=3129255 RepID=UPI003077C012
MRITMNVMFVLLLNAAAFGQEGQKPGKIKVYNAIVRVSTEEKKIVGVLAAVDDSTIHLKGSNGSLRINARAIKSIIIKRKGNVGRGALGGALSGMFLGGIIGFASGDDEPCSGWFCYTYTAEEKALAGAIVGSGLGALLGMGLGAVRKEFIIIDGNPGVFKARCDLLRMYALPPHFVGY